MLTDEAVGGFNHLLRIRNSELRDVDENLIALFLCGHVQWRRYDRGIDGAGGQGLNPAWLGAELNDHYIFGGIEAKFLEHHADRGVGSRTEAADGDFLAFDLVPRGYSFGSDQAIGEGIDASGNNNCVCPLGARSNGGWSRRYGNFDLARERGLGQDGAGVKDDDTRIETVFLKKARVPFHEGINHVDCWAGNAHDHRISRANGNRASEQERNQTKPRRKAMVVLFIHAPVGLEIFQFGCMTRKE